MTTTYQDEKIELDLLIDEALETRDVEGAHHLSEIFSKLGNEESAHYWNKQAKAWDREDWSYDESINN